MMQPMVPQIVRAGLLALALLVGACQALPYANDDRLPIVVPVPDRSPERMALNAAVWDAAIPLVARQFYLKDYGGIDWPTEASARRDAAVAQPTEVEFYAALNETLALLGDNHTFARSPAINLRRAQDRLGQGLSFGMAVTQAEGKLIVSDVDADSPAGVAGVKPGWILVSVDGQPVDLRQTYSGQPRLIRFLDNDDQPREVELTAVVRPRVPVTVRRTADGVLILWLAAFDREARERFLDTFAKELADPPRGVVVDLRDNPGGDIHEVGRVLSPFLPDRTLYAVVEARSLVGHNRSTRRRDLSYDGPLAVLTSRASASGSEMFAAAIREAGRGLIVGKRTAGAVVGSRHHALPDGGRLSIGFTGVRTGAGVVLEKVGVTPDVVTAPLPIEMLLAEIRAGGDATLEAAIAALGEDMPPVQATTTASPTV